MEKLQAAGCRIKRVPLMEDAEDVHARHTALCMYELALVHRDALTERGLGDDWLQQATKLGWPEGVVAAIEEGTRVEESAYRRGLTGMTLLRSQLDQALEEHQLDAWLSPASVEGFAPRLDENFTGDPAMNRPWSHSGSPVASIPTAGIEVDGCRLPTALQLAGPFGEDERTLATAAKLHAMLSSR